MWQMFTKVMPETTNEQSRAALTLLGMVGNIEPQIITSNINVLVEHGLNHNDLKGIFFILVKTNFLSENGNFSYFFDYKIQLMQWPKITHSE